MYRIFYLLSLSLGVFSSIVTIAFIFDLLSKVDENSGNAGAFAMALSIGVGILGIVAVTLCGALSGTIAYIYPDKLPNKIIYSCWWSILMVTPGFIGLCFIFAAWVIK
jgi:Kef-type K+ transport system membrane component KefB